MTEENEVRRNYTLPYFYQAIKFLCTKSTRYFSSSSSWEMFVLSSERSLIVGSHPRKNKHRESRKRKIKVQKDKGGKKYKIDDSSVPLSVGKYHPGEKQKKVYCKKGTKGWYGLYRKSRKLARFTRDINAQVSRKNSECGASLRTRCMRTTFFPEYTALDMARRVARITAGSNGPIKPTPCFAQISPLPRQWPNFRYPRKQDYIKSSLRARDWNTRLARKHQLHFWI